ncbi:MAG: AI-2E family transporter [Deltaproteobacteria bacterium]|nr:AI-2E family transporter [Deltaproteobacteria bacterium]
MAATIVIVVGLKYSVSVLLPVLVAVFLTVLTAPAVLWLERRRLPAWAAVVLVMVGLVAIVVLFGAVLSAAVRSFNDALPGYQRALTELVETASGWMAGLPIDLSQGTSVEAFDPNAVLKMLASLFGGVLAALKNAALVLIIVVFMLLEVAGFPRKFRAALADPKANLDRWSTAAALVQRYLVIKTATSVATGTLIALWLWWVGVDSPLLWGLVAFMLNYIPSVGSILAAVPALLVATVQPELSFGSVVLTAAGYIAVNVALGNILEPQLMGRRLGLSPLVVLLSLVFWGWVWGPFGMLLSVPLTMTVRIALEQREDTRWIAVLLAPPPPTTTAMG